MSRTCFGRLGDRGRHTRRAQLAAALLGTTVTGWACTAAAAIAALPFASGLVSPVEIAHAADGSGRLFVVEQAGRIRIVRDAKLAPVPFLDVSPLVESGGERGLLGVAFHPRFAENGRLFVNYTRRGDGATVIAAYRVPPPGGDLVDPNSAAVLLVIPQPFANHNGGTLRFGPDGWLYIGMGDGGSGNDPDNNAQNPQSLLGKLLRIDVDRATPYAIPGGNPFAVAGGRPEIFALGLRNPWKFSFDRATGDLYVADVGQSAREEIDFLPSGQGAGANFGWRVMEGFACTGLGGGPACGASSLTPPVLDYGHDDGCAITGGYVYRGAEAPSLVGHYVYADYCSGRVWAARRGADGSWHTELVLQRANGPTSFGEDDAGALFLADATSGEILRIADDTPSPSRVVEYYHPGLDHYFITRFSKEIQALDAKQLAGWVRTGAGLDAYEESAAETLPVCRFYLPPALGDSHFYSASVQECAEVRAKFPGFDLEAQDAMRMKLPDAAGRCGPGSLPVYRIWNARADSNHRYTTDVRVRDVMLSRGYLAEGYGPEGVVMCAPPPPGS